MARQLTPVAHAKIWAHYLAGLTVSGIEIETGHSWTVVASSLMKHPEYLIIAERLAKEADIHDPNGQGIHMATRQQPYYGSEEEIRQHCKTRFQWVT